MPLCAKSCTKFGAFIAFWNILLKYTRLYGFKNIVYNFLNCCFPCCEKIVTNRYYIFMCWFIQSPWFCLIERIEKMNFYIEWKYFQRAWFIIIWLWCHNSNFVLNQSAVYSDIWRYQNCKIASNFSLLIGQPRGCVIYYISVHRLEWYKYPNITNDLLHCGIIGN